MSFHSNATPEDQVSPPLSPCSHELRCIQARLFRRMMKKTLTFNDLEQHMEVLDKDIYFYTAHQCSCGVGFLSMSLGLVTSPSTMAITPMSTEKIEAISGYIQQGHCSCINDVQAILTGDINVKVCKLVHLAASSDDFLLVLEHLKTLGCDLNAKMTNEGNAPIHMAVARNQLQTVKYLLSQGVDVNIVNAEREVPLYLSVHFEHEEVFKLLLQANDIIVSCLDARRQPLLINCVRFHPEFVPFLLQAGADPNQKGYNGHTALMYAVTSRDVELVKLLICHGADVNLKNDRHEVSLLIVVYRDDAQMVQILLEAGADPNFQTHEEQNSLLLLASYDGCLEVIRLLIKFQADVQATNKLKYSPLHIAAWNGHLSCVRELLSAGAQFDTQTSDLNTPLALACHGGNMAVIEELLPLGCSVNNKDKDWDTPLLYAAFNGMTRAVEMLMSFGADPNIRNNKNTSVLWNAVYQRNKELVKLLIVSNVELECNTVGIEQHSHVDQVVHLYTAPRSTLWVAVECDASEIALLLVTAGYNIYNEDWLVNGEFPAESTDTRLHTMLTRYVHNPPRLLAWCRTFFRQHFGLKIKENVSHLYIPKTLQNYLTFDDLKYEVEPDPEPVVMEDSD